MKKALTSVIVSIVMITSSVTAIAADTSSANNAPAAQTGPLSPGGPVSVSPAQGYPFDACTTDPNLCGAVVLVGVIGMGIVIAAIMGVFSQNKITSTAAATNTR